MKKIKFILIPLLLVLFSCEIAEQIREKLLILTVDFSFGEVAVEPVVPDALKLIIDAFPKKSVDADNQQGIYDEFLATTGLNIICTINAYNPNNDRAAFDGADFHLRVNDTSSQAVSIVTSVDTFSVPEKDSTSFDITFPLMLDNSAFSKDVFQKVVQGDDIPYRVSADLFFNLVVPALTGEYDTLEGEPIALDLVNSSVPTRPDENLVTLFLQALDLILP